MAARGRRARLTTTCPRCGAESQIPGDICQGCRHYIIELPEWALPARRRWLPPWRRMVAPALVVLFLASVVWMSYPFIPNPVVLLFKRPSTDVTSAPLSGAWSMRGVNLQQTNYVPSISRQLDGRLVRSLDLGGSTRSEPAIVDGVIYLGGHFKIMALDAATGRTLWEIPTTGPVNSSPAVAGGMIYLGLLDKRIVALDRQTGELRWAFATQDISPESAAVDKGIVYMGSRDGFLYALDAKTGGLIWKLETDGPATSPPVLYEGKIFVNSQDGILYVRNSRTGDKRLRFRTQSPLLESPAAGNGLVYIESGGQVFAIDADARELPGQYQLNVVLAQLWLWQVPGVPRPPGQKGGNWTLLPPGGDFEGSFLFPPAVTPEAIYLADNRGIFYSMDPLKGTEQWQFQADVMAAAPPVVVGQRVYFGTRSGFLYALDRFSGEPQWKLSLGSPIKTRPVISDGVLYIRTGDGKLHFIE